MYEQVFDPVSDSLGLSSIFAALPLLTLFVLLGGFRVTKAFGQSGLGPPAARGLAHGCGSPVGVCCRLVTDARPSANRLALQGTQHLQPVASFSWTEWRGLPPPRGEG